MLGLLRLCALSSSSIRIHYPPSSPNLFLHLVAGTAVVRPAVAGPAIPAVAVLPPEGLQPLLLGVCVDVGSNEETDDVEERHPGLLGQESLGEGQSDRGGDPGNLHDGHEARADGGADLVESARAGDDGHAEQVDQVLDR